MNLNLRDKLLFYTFLVLFLAACNPNKKEAQQTAKYIVVNPIRIDTIYVSEYVADIHSKQNVEIRARIKGYLEAIHVDEGMYVKAGQKLFTISSLKYREELLKAKATLKSVTAEAKAATLRLNNVQQLVNKNVVSNSELEMEQAKVEVANADVEIAKSNEYAAELNLSYTEIKAPFDGIINRIPYKTGSLISEETLLTSISNNKEVYAYFNISEREYLDFRDLSPTADKRVVELILANNKTFPFKGTIETVEGEFDKNTGNIAFRARFPNPDDILKNGSSGKLQIKNVLKNVIIIPQKSTFEIQDKVYAFVLNKKDATVQMKNIVPKLRLQHLYVLESGLNESDQFVYEGIQHLKDGDKIIPETVLLKKLLAEEMR